MQGTKAASDVQALLQQACQRKLQTSKNPTLQLEKDAKPLAVIALGVRAMVRAPQKSNPTKAK